MMASRAGQGRGVAALVTLVALLGSTSASAQPVVAPPPAESGPSGARARGGDRVQRGPLGRTRALFARAFAEQPNARIARGLGLAAYELRHYVEAVRRCRPPSTTRAIR